MHSLFWQQKILWRGWQNFGTKWSFGFLYVRILAQIFKNSFGIYVWWNFLFYECSVQFEVLSSPTNSKWTTELTDIYDKYLEDWVGDYWLQPKYLPEGFKVLKSSVWPKPLPYFLILLHWQLFFSEVVKPWKIQIKSALFFLLCIENLNIGWGNYCSKLLSAEILF